MNIIVSYDFIETIKGSNEPKNPIKMIKYTLKHNLVWKAYMIGQLAISSIKEPFLTALGESLIAAGGAFLFVVKRDPEKERSDRKIDDLCFVLQKIDVNTDQFIIKESRLEGKKYEIRLNEKNFHK